jgi:hypothetical protein
VRGRWWGEGRVVFEEGVWYEGGFVGGVVQGEGRFVNGVVDVTGEWRGGRVCGRAIVKDLRGGRRLEGVLRENLRDGFCRI